MKRSHSLNRFIAVSAVVIGAVCVAILLIVNIIFINSHQRIQRETENNLLSSYVNRCSKVFKDISLFVNDLSVNDSNFIDLSGSRDEEQEYDSVYTLDMAMRVKIRMEEQMHGYILFYRYGNEVRYYMNTDIISTDDMRQIRSIIKEFVYDTAGNQPWGFMMVNDHTYGYRICARGQAAFCALYSLEPIKRQILEASASADDVLCVWGGNVFVTEDLLDWYDAVPDMTESYEYSFRIRNRDEYVYGQRVENSDLWLCMIVPISLFSYISVPQILLILFTGIFIYIMLMVLKALRREILNPLREMTGVMERIRGGEWDAHMSRINRFEEIESVNDAMETMVSEIKKQKMVSYEQTIEKQKAQMQYLQLQLKPHFYLNGLKTINVLAMNGDTGRVQDLIMRLSYHLRYLLQVEQERVALQSEIDYVKNYASLKEDMTGRPFCVQWNIQENIGMWYVPTLCIQTFVENSFKYAKLGSADSELIIRIGVHELNTEEGIFLDIQVSDNGAGYPEEVLDEINAVPAEGSRMVGINNIKRRCRLMYGDAAEFYFYNENGACSEMILPQKAELEHKNMEE